MARLSVTNRGALVSIGGVAVPRGASKMTIKYYDISDADSGNSMTGVMWKGYLGTKRELNIVFNALRPAQARAILQAMRTNPNGFSVEFYDVESGTYATSTFYCGDRTADILWFHPNHEITGITFNLIEVAPYV